MTRSIPSPLIPPGLCWAFFHFFSCTVGHLLKIFSPGVGIVKNKSKSDFRSSIWFHSNMCKYLYNCLHLRIRDDRQRNVPGAWNSFSFSCLKAISAITDPIKTFIGERLLLSCSAGWSFALFQKLHHGVFVRVSWPHGGAFAKILKTLRWTRTPSRGE